jgi:cell wall-associated NlpC family hydrolase
MTPSRPDRRINPWREDLAAEELRGMIEAPRYTEGETQRVVVGRAPLRREPRDDAGLDTEAVFGEAIRVLDRADGWCWVQLERDRYVGYMPASALGDGAAVTTHRVTALATFLYPRPDIKAPPRLSLPLGSELAVVRHDERFAELASGGFVIGRHIAERARHARDFVDVAERFIGVPYLWGGRTHCGLDCSGLVQSALAAAGLACPRDSDQQEAALGTAVLVPETLEGLERGDLVFWPGHVGIMVDGVMLLHANAHHMAVAVEPLKVAAARIARSGDRVRTVKRLPALGAGALRS